MQLNRRQLLAGASAAAFLGHANSAFAATDITYWHHFTSQTEFAALKKIQEMFAQRFPNIALTPEGIPNPDFMGKIAGSMVTSGPPDTLMVEPDRLADLIAMGTLVDVSDRYSKWDGKIGFEGDRIRNMSVSGRVYGVPSFTYVEWAYYRPDFFEQVGLPGPPKNFDEFLKACEMLTDPSKGRYGFGMRGGAGAHNHLLSVIEAFGSPIVVDGKPAMNREFATDAVTFFSDIFLKLKAAPPSAPSDGYRQIMEGFRTGQTAMVWHHTGSLAEVASSLAPTKEFGTALLPAGPKKLVTRVSYYGNGIGAGKNIESAWEWVKFWADTEVAITLLEQTGYFPASTTVLKDKRVASNPIYQPASKALDLGVPGPTFVGYAAWAEKVVTPAFQGVLTGQNNPREAVDMMIRGLEAAVH